MTAEHAVIEVREMRKSFGSAVALDGVDLVVPPGQVHGFLGPNGAGKSTTIRILLGLLRADGGSAAVFGRDAWADAVQIHRRLAYVPGDVSLWPNLSGGEAIDLLTRLHGTVDLARRADMLERFELDPTKKIKTYSKGNRQKVALVAALSCAADLYILDEPTSGLDPLMEAVFRRSVTELRDTGATILLSSHILAEVEELCDQLSIIRQGRIVESGSLADLRHLSRIEVRAQTRDTATGLADQPGVHDVVVDGTELRCHVDGPELQRFLEALTGLGVVSLICQPPTLEELFLRHYGDRVDDDRATGAAPSGSPSARAGAASSR